MRASATVLCNNILYRAKCEKISITPMKLQKLLYYVCTLYVKRTGRLPISEHFEVWQYGPVAASVYAEFRPFGSRPIIGYAQNAKGKATMVDEAFNPTLTQCLDIVWGKFKHLSGIQLSELTHQKGSGWWTAYQEERDAISTEDMKNDSTIREREEATAY